VKDIYGGINGVDVSLTDSSGCIVFSNYFLIPILFMSDCMGIEWVSGHEYNSGNARIHTWRLDQLQQYLFRLLIL
jgi:hypothetical protein